MLPEVGRFSVGRTKSEKIVALQTEKPARRGLLEHLFFDDRSLKRWQKQRRLELDRKVQRQVLRRCSGAGTPSEGPGTANLTTLTFAQSTPNAKFFTVGQCVFQAVVFYDAASAHFFCFSG
jgi:hypothetical protein